MQTKTINGWQFSTLAKTGAPFKRYTWTTVWYTFHNPNNISEIKLLKCVRYKTIPVSGQERVDCLSISPVMKMDTVRVHNTVCRPSFDSLTYVPFHILSRLPINFEVQFSIILMKVLVLPQTESKIRPSLKICLQSFTDSLIVSFLCIALHVIVCVSLAPLCYVTPTKLIWNVHNDCSQNTKAPQNRMMWQNCWIAF